MCVVGYVTRLALCPAWCPRRVLCFGACCCAARAYTRIRFRRIQRKASRGFFVPSVVSLEQRLCLFSVVFEIVADYFGMAWHMDSFQIRAHCPHDGLKEVPSVDSFEEVGKSLSADRQRP